jgi:hypothetical protein
MQKFVEKELWLQNVHTIQAEGYAIFLITSRLPSKGQTCFPYLQLCKWRFSLSFQLHVFWSYFSRAINDQNSLSDLPICD